MEFFPHSLSRLQPHLPSEHPLSVQLGKIAPVRISIMSQGGMGSPSSIRKGCKSIKRELFQGIQLHSVLGRLHSAIHYGLHGAEVFQSLPFTAGLPKDSKNQSQSSLH